jgi:DMSO reductase anchor subunit
MRPTFSIIAFTVLSGAGYGLWFLVGLALAVESPVCVASQPCEFPGAIAAALIVGFVLVSAGLLCSLGHLGQPARAWRAFSQWRSSWLSREGVASILTYIPAVLLMVAAVASWLRPIESSASAHSFGLVRVLGAALAVLSAVTVYCTANIYASLKPIRAWNHRYVVAIYLLLGLLGGALCVWMLTAWPSAMNSAARARDTSSVLAAIVVLAALCLVLKALYWRDIDRLPALGAGAATGLGALGTTRSFEQPHTEENYLTREMGFVLARKHASKLRAIALIGAFVVPGLFALVALFAPGLNVLAAWLAFAFGIAGLFVERWLFFAQARHAVTGYYARH